jgi:hypothetical protein
MFALVVASSALACWRLVPASGLAGGAMAMVVGGVVRLVLAAAVVGYLFLVDAKRVVRRGAPDTCVNEWNTAL